MAAAPACLPHGQVLQSKHWWLPVITEHIHDVILPLAPLAVW
jgi:hypothetical protein